MKSCSAQWKMWVVVGLWAILLSASVVHVVGTQFSWSRLVNAGQDELVKVPEVALPDDFEINRDGGYDGTAYYYVANDLMPDKLQVGLIRYRRILYPFISRVLSFGDLSRGMFLANVLGVVIFAAACLKLAKGPWALTCLLAQPALWFSLQYGLTDLWGLSMLAWALVCWPKRPIVGALFFLLACLSRETILIVVVGVLVQQLIKKNYKQMSYLVVVVASWGLWSMFLSWRYPEATMQGGLVFPLSGWYAFFVGDFGKKDLPQFLIFIDLLILLYWCVKNKKHDWLLPVFMFVGATFCMKLAIMEHFLAIGRVVNPILFLWVLVQLNDTKNNSFFMKVSTSMCLILFCLCALRQFVISEEITWVLWKSILSS